VLTTVGELISGDSVIDAALERLVS
jgi:hypothetical protein